VAIGGERLDLDLGMPKQQAHEFAAGVTGRAENPDFRLGLAHGRLLQGGGGIA
jgi:hypothetical protein